MLLIGIPSISHRPKPQVSGYSCRTTWTNSPKRHPFATLRQGLLKNPPGTRSGVVEQAARIRIHFASACPDAVLFRLPAGRLPVSGP